MKKIGEIIRLWREELGLSQQAVADMCRTTHITVNRWEKGKHEPSKENVRLLSEKLKIPYQDFLKGPEHWNEKKKSQDLSNKISFSPVSLDRISNLYLLTDIRENIYRSTIVGHTFRHQTKENPDKWIDVIVNLPNQPFEQNKVVSVYTLENPKKGDLVLVWNPDDGAHFVQWDEGDNDFETVYGPVLGGNT